jgi:hypothetical protein
VLSLPRPDSTSERRWEVRCADHEELGTCPLSCRTPARLISLTYGDYTTRNTSRRRTNGGGWDGWCLRVRHARSRIVLTEHYLGAAVPELQLQTGLDAIGAVPVPVPTRSKEPTT